MDNVDFEKMKEKVKSSMSEARFNHTLGVVSEAEKLAKLNNVDPEKAKVAALLHDIAKEMTEDEVARYTREHNIDLSYLKNFEKIVHSHLGYYIARDIYQITDEEILLAIKYHTTGHTNISLFGKIIYVADFIEPGRNAMNYMATYQQSREIAYRDIQEAYTYILGETIRFLRVKGQIPFIDTLEAYDVAF